MIGLRFMPVIKDVSRIKSDRGFFLRFVSHQEGPEEIGGNRKPSANFELEMISQI